jgi:hypothetical protein
MTYDHDETPEEALERNLERIRTEGLDAATEAALALLRDAKAPAQAKSATINAIFRASGLFSRDDDGSEVEPHQMTAEQLAREINRLEKEIRAARRGQSDADGEGDLFG